MKKALAAGIGAVFMTEESLRGYLSEAKLPRDIAKYILQSSQAAKQQLYQYVSKEVAQLIRRTDIPALVAKLLESHEIEIEAKVRFKPTGGVEVTGLAGRALPRAGAPGAGDGGGEVDDGQPGGLGDLFGEDGLDPSFPDERPAPA